MNAVLGVGRARTALLPLLGVLLGLALWQLAGSVQVLGRALPPASDVAQYLVDPANTNLIQRALAATGAEALAGFVIGASVAMVLAITAGLLPVLRTSVGRLSAMVNAAPWIALGPLFAILYRDQTPVIIATLAVFFNCFVAFSTGLSRTNDSHDRVFTALGASPVRRLLSLQLPSALPSLLDGLRLAVPAAMVGAIFGEWFGSTRGIGTLLVTAMQNLRVEQLWAAAALAALISLAGYGLFTLLYRLAKARFA